MSNAQERGMRDVLIDPEDRHLLAGHRWRIKPCRNTQYLTTSLNIGPKGSRKQVTQGIHRLIMDLIPGDGKMVDHINGDGLDNRRSNLRLCNYGSNGMNRKPNKNKKTSKFKGVHFSKRKNKWVSQIKVNRKLRLVGYFKTEKEAAEAYDKRSKIEFGEFARPNF